MPAQYVSVASPTTGAWRAVRAVLVIALVVCLSTGGHLIAGGQVASWRAAALALLLVAVGAAGATALRLTPMRLMAVLGAGQLVVHHALSWTPGGHCATAGSSELFKSMTHAGCGTVGAHEAAGAHEAVWSDPVMLLAHVVATVVAGVVLGRGEQLLWTICALLQARPLVLPELLLPEDTQPVRAPILPRRPHRVVLSESDPLRDPPATPLASPVPV